jgi:SAM-dependent methyltransferase
MTFHCRVCDGSVVDRALKRGDGVDVLFCRRCDMGVVDPIPETTAQFYGDGYYGAGGAALAEPGGLSYADYEFTAEHSLLWLNCAVEYLGRPKRILDVGCAAGSWLANLRGSHVRAGIEVNAAAARRARERGISVIADDILAPSLLDGRLSKFDLVTAIATLEHVADFKKALKACLALLAEGGIMLFEVPLISKTRDNHDWLNGSYEHIWYPTEKALGQLGASFPGVTFAGFECFIEGYSSTYVGAAAASDGAVRTADALLDAMTTEKVDRLSPDGRCLNVAFNLVHCFRSTPGLIKSLPLLLERRCNPNLAKRLAARWAMDLGRITSS